jgi:serine/threonine protein kinase
MGEVYRARDPRLEREVAIKVLPPRLASEDRLRRFTLEARVTGTLSHPNILAVFDTGREGEIRYLVSELLEGETLCVCLRRGPLSAWKAVDYATQVGRGLAAAHEKEIAHRDLKPSNLFVTWDGRVKILDFGLAKLTSRAAVDALLAPAAEGRDAPTRPGALLGTVHYMSPEQVLGLPADRRSDIFALGAILFEMLLRRRPFEAPTPVETMCAILNEDPPELSGRVLPPDVTRVLRRCLEKEPQDRFATARELVFDLETIAQTSSLAAGRPGAPLVRRTWSPPLARTDTMTAFALGILAGRSGSLAPLRNFSRRAEAGSRRIKRQRPSATPRKPAKRSYSRCRSPAQ